MPITPIDYDKARLLIRAETDPELQFRVASCEKEPWTVEFIEAAARENPGAAFWDVGANVGTYTLIALANGLRCVAIEPGFANYARLCENLALNDLLSGPVFTLCGALGAETHFEWFQYSDLRPGGASHLLGGERRTSFQRQRVLVNPLDDLMGLEPGPWYLKIDVDGGEVDVLKGAQEFLRAAELQGICIEMALELEAEATALLVAAGWTIAERHQPRQGVCYGIFRRPGPVATGIILPDAPAD